MLRFADYRLRLEAAAAAWFAGRGLAVQHAPYILARHADWPLNLVDPAWADLVTAERARRQAAGQGFPLHRFVHHGLSSQAMLFNLVLPLLARDDAEALAGAFGAVGAPWPGPEARLSLEVEDRGVFGETRGQPTSLDLCVEGPGGSPLFVEAKLVEPGFGVCSLLAGGDCEGANPAGAPAGCPLHRWGRRYWTVLDELGFTPALAEGPTCLLGTHYQFFREVGFALARGGHLVLLVHDDNPAFRRPDASDRGLWPLLTGLVPEAHRARLHLLPLRTVVAALAATGRHDDWLPDFVARYALGAPAPPATGDADAALATLPAEVAAAVRALWSSIRGSKARGDGQGRTGQRRISALLRDAGVARDDPRFEAVIAHGRTLHEEEPG